MSNGLAVRQKTEETLPEEVEKLLATGDLKDLTTQQRIIVYKSRCDAAGLDPRGRPFEFISMQGKLVLYAKKECAEQLNGIHGISHKILSRNHDKEGGIYEVSVSAAMRDGRSTEDIGVVAVPNLKGEALANAYMKAITKAKRRATLSLCGLGDVIDESELDTMVNVRTVEEDGSPKKITNNTDFGAGKYCSLEEGVEALRVIAEYRDARESQWLDRWTNTATGEIPDGLKELCPMRTYPVDNHLAKQAVKTRRLAQDCMDMSGLRPYQEGRLTGIIWHRSDEDKAWMNREMKLYFDELERTATDALLRVHPELFSEDKAEEPPVAVAVAQPESAPQSEWGKWLVEQVDSFNKDMAPAPPVKAQQVANHLVNEGISDGRIQKPEIETGGKRDNKKVGDVLKNMWNKNAADLMDRVGKYLAAKAIEIAKPDTEVGQS
jgi:hypothetical protein